MKIRKVFVLALIIIILFSQSIALCSPEEISASLRPPLRSNHASREVIGLLDNPELITALKALGFKSPEKYPEIMALGLDEVKRRLEDLRRADPEFNYNGIADPQKRPDILLKDLGAIKERVRDFKSIGIADPENHLSLLVTTLTQSFERLRQRALDFDAIEGLPLSYKPGPGVTMVVPEILISRAETVKDNLLILKDYGIINYTLLKNRTQKLRRNILFLESVGLGVRAYSVVLSLPTRDLQLNYMVLNDLGIEITTRCLRKRTATLIREIREGKHLSPKPREEIDAYLEQVEKGEKAPQLIVGAEERDGEYVPVTREETIAALEKLGIKNPENYPNLIVLGEAIVAQRIEILKKPNPTYKFKGIKNPLTWPLIMGHSIASVMECSLALKTPDPEYDFNGLRNPESYPQIYGYDPATIKAKVKTLKTPDPEYNFNGISVIEGSASLLTAATEVVKEKVRRIKEELQIEDIEDHPILLQGAVDSLIDKARRVDAIPGLRFSYKKGPEIDKIVPTILVVKPETLMDNLLLFQQYGIDPARHYNVLASCSHLKVRTNIEACKRIGFDFVSYPDVLMVATATIVTNYTILTHVGGRVTSDNLGKSTKALIKALKDGKISLDTQLSPRNIARYLARAKQGRIRIAARLNPATIRRDIEKQIDLEMAKARRIEL